MLKVYSEFRPIAEETETEFWRRKAQDRAQFIGEQKDTISKLRGTLGDIQEIIEAGWA